MKKLTLLTLLAFMAVGCPSKKDTSRNVQVRGQGVVGGGELTPGVCGQNLSSVGTIYDSAGTGVSLYNTGTFEDRVKALLSATIAPEEVGQISSGPTDTTGVRFQGTIKVDANGKVVLASSKMLIKVYDSYVALSQYNTNGQKYEAIPIEFTAATEGQFNAQTGEGYVLFRDNYGDVRFDGKIDAQYFSGKVSFKNNVNVTGAAPAQAELGQFYVARCAIIQ